MARYRLPVFVLEVLLNPKQTNKRASYPILIVFVYFVSILCRY